MHRPPTAFFLPLLLTSCGNVDDGVAPDAPAPSTEVPADWLTSVSARVEAAGRAIHQVDGDYVVDLAPAGLVGRFDDAGAVFTDLETGEPALGLRLEAWGRAGALRPAEPAEPDFGDCGPDVDPTGACLRQLEHRRGALTEWWLGQGNGVEQGWTLTRAPEGSGDLVFEVALDEALALDATGAALEVTDARGRAWTIDGVIAWDARGEPLPADARFEEGALVVTVDDTGAVYPLTVDPIYTTAAWTWLGGTANFGYAVAGAGDVDGDGYDDVVVGAYGVGSDTGWAYVFHGSSTGIAGTATTRLDGETVGDFFGQAVAGAGDVNGDGFDDVIVGACGYSSYAGRTYIFHGSASGVSTTATSTVDGSSSSYFGYAVASAGDVDADGYDDVIVGAYRYSTSTGQAYVHHGSVSGVSTTAASTLTGGASSNYFGCSVAGAGDVDDDGYDDVIVGAYGYSSSTGRAYVYHGAASGVSTSAATTLTGSTVGMQFGYDVSGVGDVNADGYDDVIVGAPAYSSSTGRAYVHHGSASGVSTSATTTLVGYTSYNYFGSSVAGLGDVEGDGYDDVAVGAYGYSSSTGRVTVYDGTSAGINSMSVASLTGSSSSNYFGAGLDRAGDVNADGRPDLVVGAYGVSSSSGAAYVYHGASSGMSTSASRSITSPSPYAYFPTVSKAGDLDADGYGDFAIGNSGYSSNNGIVYVFLGDSGGPADITADATLTGSWRAYLGQTLAAAGDVDNDGYDDLLVGAYNYSTDTGRVALYRGRASGIDTTATTTLTGPSSSDFFGISMASLGDTNGDGYDDVMIGAHGAGTGGVAYLYQGSSSGLGASATSSFTVGSAGINNGESVTGGDFDGDGRRDAAVSAPAFSSYGGEVFVFQGTGSGVSTTVWRTLTGEAASNYFGQHIEAADVDGDGYDDLIIGAYGYDSSQGRLYVYYGSSSGVAALPATTITGTSASERLGETFAVVGDVNADGYADVVVSESDYLSGVGRFYLFEGAAAGLETTAGVTLTGHVHGGGGMHSYLGSSISGAGDVNGDGFDDVIAGGYTHTWLFYGYDTDSDGDGVPDSSDCDAADATIYPGATEVCDGVDQDCDGTADDGVDFTLYADDDGDGYGDPDDSLTSCAASASGYVSDDADCDDTSAAISPAGIETCDGVDNNCNGSSDEDDATDAVTWYADDDGDGYGGSTTRNACSMPTGYVATSTDCDDATATTYAGATESCNGTDDDCDGSADESGSTGESTWYADADADGAGDASVTVRSCSAPTGYVATGTDCDDSSGTVYVGAAETCNGVDDDCDGSTDEGVMTTWYYDADGDGYTGTAGSVACSAPAGYSAASPDCDDGAASTWPGAAEVCDGVDQNCDGSVDEGVLVTFYRDLDADGYGDSSVRQTACSAPAGYTAVSGDCDDADAAESPGAPEVCDGLDQDCDGVIDEGVMATWYRDADRDSYGDASLTSEACTAPRGFIVDGTDCDDATAGVNPGEAERCDELDNNCDSEVDEGVTTVYYLDADGDGFGWGASTVEGCSPPEGYVTNADDCDDTDPSLTEGVTGYRDADQDGYGDASAPLYGCAMPDGYVGESTDCDDAAAGVNPGVEEVWYDDVDQDCDGNDDDQDGDGLAVGDDCDDTDAAVGACDTATDTAGDSGSGDHDDDDDKPTGPCGCASGSGGADHGVLLAGLLAAVAARRRRQPQSPTV